MIGFTQGILMTYGNVLMNIMRKSQNIQNTEGHMNLYIMKRAQMKVMQGRENYI